MSPKKVLIGLFACALVFASATFVPNTKTAQRPSASVMATTTPAGGVLLNGWGGIVAFGGA